MKRYLLVLLCLCSLAGACWGQDPNASVVQGSATGTALPVTGTLTANQGTSPWVVNSGERSLVTGLLNVAGQTLDIPTNGAQSVLARMDFEGSWNGRAFIRTSPDGSNYYAVSSVDLQNGNSTYSYGPDFHGSVAYVSIAAHGATHVQVFVSFVTAGSVTISARASDAVPSLPLCSPGFQFSIDQKSGTSLGVSPQLFDANNSISEALKSASSIIAGSVGADIAPSALFGYDGANFQYIGVNGSHALKVDGSAVTQPVSGTFWQATQPVSGTFWQATQPVSGTFWQATQPVSGTFWQATQPISAASLPLPTGAATESTLATLPLAQGSTTSGQSGILGQGAVTTSAPTYTTAKTSPLSLTTAGSLRVDGSGATQPISGTVTANAGTGTFTVDGSGHTQPVSGTVTANQGGTWTVQPGNTANTTAWKVDGSAVTQPVSGTFWQATQPVSGTVTANQGGAPWSAAGTLTNNNAAPGANNVGALPALANAAVPSWTEGNQIALSADLSGGLRTLAQGLVSTANSSTTPLTNSATFTGTGEDVSNYSTVGVYCVSVHPGGVPALHAEFSNDNTNWDLNESTSLITGVAVYRTYAVKGKYFRIVLNNGTSAQSALRLQVIYHQNPVTKGQYANDALLVDGSATTQPVSGTFWQATQPVSGTFWQATQPVSGTVTANAGTGTFTVGGIAAHGASISGNPVRIGARAVNADITQVTNGQTTDLLADLAGKLVVLPYTFPENFESGATGNIVDTSATSVIAAPSTGIRNYITQLTVINSHATVNTWVNIKDGSGGSTLYTVYCQNSGGGVSITLPVPLRQTAATALIATCETTGANVRVSASGYKAP